MKKMTSAIIALSFLSMGAYAVAAPAAQNNQSQNYPTQNGQYHNGYDCNQNGHRGDRGNRGHRGMNNYHGNSQVFQSSVQTDSPSEALKKISNDAPAMNKDGKQYKVRVSVYEVQPNNVNSAPANN